MNTIYREELYRSRPSMERLRHARVTVCGAGALGGNLIESLARCGFGTLKVIDRDRVEEHNLSTQPYQLDDVGGHKAKVLAHRMYRAVGLEIDALVFDLSERNVSKLLKQSDLVIDVFDNSVSRQVVADCCQSQGVPCLHAGLADGYAEVLWDDVYRVPTAALDDICDYPLARNLVTLTVAIASETIIGFVLTGEKHNRTITLKDLSIRRFELT